MGDNTQASVDLLSQMKSILTELSLQGHDATLVHDQEHTNLCHSFATMSCFRKCIMSLVEAESKTNMFCAVSEMEKEMATGEYSFRNMLTVFLGCVSPRSYKSDSTTQFAQTETVIARLAYRTVFEVEGWKRIIPVRRLFQRIRLNINDYELTYQKVEHPNSHSVQQVLLDIDGQSWFPSTSSTFKVQDPCWLEILTIKIVTYSGY